MELFSMLSRHSQNLKSWIDFKVVVPLVCLLFPVGVVVDVIVAGGGVIVIIGVERENMAAISMKGRPAMSWLSSNTPSMSA